MAKVWDLFKSHRTESTEERHRRKSGGVSNIFVFFFSNFKTEKLRFCPNSTYEIQ